MTAEQMFDAYFSLPVRGREQRTLPPKGKSPEISQATRTVFGKGHSGKSGEIPAPKV